MKLEIKTFSDVYKYADLVTSNLNQLYKSFKTLCESSYGSFALIVKYENQSGETVNIHRNKRYILVTSRKPYGATTKSIYIINDKFIDSEPDSHIGESAREYIRRIDDELFSSDKRKPSVVNVPAGTDVRPSYYGGDSNPFEPIKIINHYKLNFNIGNVIKYLLRAGKKDLYLVEFKKAKQYLEFEIARLEKLPAEPPLKNAVDAIKMAQDAWNASQSIKHKWESGSNLHAYPVDIESICAAFGIKPEIITSKRPGHADVVAVSTKYGPVAKGCTCKQCEGVRAKITEEYK